jgi:hypothetical protein
MNKTLDQQLCERYPKIFANRYADMTTTAMCWGFECGDGWFNILDQLCSQIQHHIDWKERQREVVIRLNSKATSEEIREVPKEISQVVAEQVKEKYGTLRFYYDGGDERISGMVTLAEGMSEVTCEQCGAPGLSRHGGWVRTLCETHYQQKETA